MDIESSCSSPRSDGRELPGLTIVALGLTSPLDDALINNFTIVYAATAEDVLLCFAKYEVGVFILGTNSNIEDPSNILARCLLAAPEQHPLNLVLLLGEPSQQLQGMVDDKRVFYLARHDLQSRELNLLITAAATSYTASATDQPRILVKEIGDDEDVLDFCLRLSAQNNVSQLSSLLARGVTDFLSTDCTQCALYDREEELLKIFSTNRPTRVESAALGLVGFAARTGERLQLESARSDPRYDSETDDLGDFDRFYMAVPIQLDRDLLIGVIIAARGSNNPPFLSGHLKLLELLATSAAMVLQTLLYHEQLVDARLKRAKSLLDHSGLFEKEALEYHLQQWNDRGELITTSPCWLKRSSLLVLAVCILGILYLLIRLVAGCTATSVSIRSPTRAESHQQPSGLFTSPVPIKQKANSF